MRLTECAQILCVKRFAFSFLLTGSLLAGLTQAGYAQSPEEGQTIFEQQCVACHTIGGGALVGPDLQDVTSLRDRDWLIRWIMAPDQVLAEGDPIATELLTEFNNVPMPNLGLTETQATAILAYIESASTGESVAVPTISLPPGNAQNGQALFIGQQSLANGGPPCISCHSAGNIALLGGGTLGPNLTHAADTYGEVGLQAALVGLPFPTMQGVFANRPLTEQEAADLHAYLVQMDQTTAPQTTGYNFLWVGLGGSVVLLGLCHVTWINRRKGVRKPLVGR